GRHGDLLPSIDETPVIDHEAIADSPLGVATKDNQAGRNRVGGAAIILVNQPARAELIFGQFRSAYLDLPLLFWHCYIFACNVDQMNQAVFTDIDFFKQRWFGLG